MTRRREERDTPSRGDYAPFSAPRAPERPAVSVRRATLDDLSTVVSMRLALLREHADNPVYRRLHPDVQARARQLFTAQLQSTSEAIFLAERSARPVGVLRCVDTASSPLLLPARYGYVSSVYVEPSARRGGVLRALLDAAAAWCESRELSELRLHNAADNVAANLAWEALGFEIVEHVRLRPLRQSPSA